MNVRIRFAPIDLWLDGLDRDGRLVFADDQLVAVIVQLEDGVHGSFRGYWNFEATFGPCDRGRWLAPVRDLDAVARLVAHRIGQRARNDALSAA